MPLSYGKGVVIPSNFVLFAKTIGSNSNCRFSTKRYIIKECFQLSSFFCILKIARKKNKVNCNTNGHWEKKMFVLLLLKCSLNYIESSMGNSKGIYCLWRKYHYFCELKRRRIQSIILNMRL